MTTTAKIAAKGTKGTGITEEVAKRLHDRLGKKILVLAEIRSDNRTETLKGDEQVTLIITDLEVAAEGIAVDHVRELMRSFYYERQLADGQMEIKPDGEGIQPKVADVINANPGLKPHPYVSSQLAIDDSPHGPVCDVCGMVEAATALHNMPATDPFAAAESADADDEDAEDAEDAEDQDDIEVEEDEEGEPGDDFELEVTHPDQPHNYLAGPDELCRICQHGEYYLAPPDDAAIHPNADWDDDTEDQNPDD